MVKNTPRARQTKDFQGGSRDRDFPVLSSSSNPKKKVDRRSAPTPMHLHKTTLLLSIYLSSLLVDTKTKRNFQNILEFQLFTSCYQETPTEFVLETVLCQVLK
jgi:hypothetical protein